MKKFFNLYQLSALHTFVPAMLISLVMVAVQSGLFAWNLYLGGGNFPFTSLVDDAFMTQIFTLALMATAAASAIAIEGKSGRIYTARRLGVPVSHIGFAIAGNTLVNLLTIWGIEAVTLFVLHAIFQSATDPMLWSIQTLFIDSYRIPLLHAIFPTVDWILWVRNFAILLTVSLKIANWVLASWRGTHSVMGVVALIVLNFYARDSVGTAMDIVFIAGGVFASFIAIAGILEGDQIDE